MTKLGVERWRRYEIAAGLLRIEIRRWLLGMTRYQTKGGNIEYLDEGIERRSHGIAKHLLKLSHEGKIRLRRERPRLELFPQKQQAPGRIVSL